MRLYLLIISILYYIFFASECFANKGNGGLEFQANNVKIQDRTSWNMFDKGIKFPKDSLKLQFDMSIYGDNMIGHILTCKDSENEYFNIIVYQDVTLSDTLYFNLNFTYWNQKTIIPISRKDARKWQNVLISIYPKDGKAVFCIGNRKQIIKNENCKKDIVGRLSFFFGKCGHYLDLLPFSLKNVYYFSDNEKIYFPLNENNGEIIHSIDNKYVGYVENPSWIGNKYYHWIKVAELEENEIAAIFHDKKENNIVIKTSDKTIIFDTFSWKKNELDLSNDEKFKFLRGEANYVYDTNTSELIMFNNIYSSDYKAICKYNYRKRNLNAVGNSTLRYKYHHNSVFSDKEMKNIYQFGGYFSFKYSNTFYRMNTSDFRWESIIFKGDTIMPRFYTSVGYDFAGKNEYVYLYGGYGNESGSQKDGSRYFYDLYRINLPDTSIVKVCEFPMQGLDYVPSRDLILSNDGDGFYTLCSTQYKPESHAILYKFNWNDLSFKTIGDSIPYLSQKISTQVHLFEDEISNCFICAIQEFVTANKSKIKIYKISYPCEQDEKSNLGFYYNSNLKNYIIIFGGALILLVGFIYFKRVKRHSNLYNDKKENEVSDIVLNDENGGKKEENNNQIMIRNNSIFMLGDFAVFGKTGKDITYMFSSKIRQLFLLILLYSYKEQYAGISSNEISTIIWPEKELSKSKNVRGVTMKNLKEVLSEIEGIKLIYQSGKWIIDIDQTKCFCDYINLISCIINKNDNYDHVKPSLSLLRRGRLLQSESLDWIDPFKADFEDIILEKYCRYMINSYKRSDFIVSYKISQVLLGLDPLNEDIMKIEINSLCGMGDIVKARMKFRQFAISYYEVYGTNIDINDFLEQEYKTKES